MKRPRASLRTVATNRDGLVQRTALDAKTSTAWSPAAAPAGVLTVPSSLVVLFVSVTRAVTRAVGRMSIVPSVTSAPFISMRSTAQPIGRPSTVNDVTPLTPASANGWFAVSVADWGSVNP